LQKRLACRVKLTPLKKTIQTVAGIDCAFSGNGQKIIACIVVLKFPEFEIIEILSAVRKVRFPYVPGLLSFREAPVCIAAAKKLKTEPDLFIIDGQGIAHPRRLGLAAHLGLFFDKPTVGCAKSRLVGQYKLPGTHKGRYTWLNDKDEVIGAVVRTRSNVKPVFISVGNRCLLEDAIKISLACVTKYRLPEPTRLAHQQVSKKRAGSAL